MGKIKYSVTPHPFILVSQLALPLLQVIETDPEPAHSVVEENYRELHLQISANVNFASYQCQTSNVHFKETLVYQTRVFE